MDSIGEFAGYWPLEPAFGLVPRLPAECAFDMHGYAC